MKFCKSCGNTLDDEAIHCELCGEKQDNTYDVKECFENSVKNVSDKDAEITHGGELVPYDYRRGGEVYFESAEKPRNPSYYIPPAGSYNAVSAVQKETNLKCLIGFILGIMSFFLTVLSVVGLTVSIVGILSFDEETESGKGFGIAGIVINSVLLLVSVVFVLLMLYFLFYY